MSYYKEPEYQYFIVIEYKNNIVESANTELILTTLADLENDLCIIKDYVIKEFNTMNKESSNYESNLLDSIEENNIKDFLDWKWLKNPFYTIKWYDEWGNLICYYKIKLRFIKRTDKLPLRISMVNWFEL